MIAPSPGMKECSEGVASIRYDCEREWDVSAAASDSVVDVSCADSDPTSDGSTDCSIASSSKVGTRI